MKKSGKFFSYVLVLALIVSLLSGLGFKAENVSADDETPAPVYTVLEIVPAEDMGIFSLLVGQKDVAVSINDVPILRKKGSSSTTENWETAGSKLAEYGIGTVDTSAKTFTSKDYFRQNVLSKINSNAVNWTIDVQTKTPSDIASDIELLKKADLIVINQTIPSWLKGLGNGTFASSGMTKDTVWNIVKKITGLLDGKPVPYIIDFKLYDLNKDDVTYNFGSGPSKAIRGVLPAPRVATVSKGSDGTARLGDFKGGKYTYRGSSLNSFKLFKMLTCIDPATLYGLFFKGNDGSFGYDEDLNQIFLYTSDAQNIPLFNMNGKSQEWSEVLFAPWAYSATDLGKSNYNFESAVDDAISKMNWFLASDATFNSSSFIYKNPYDNVCKEIGSGVGNGVVFNHTDGLFYVMKQFAPVPATSSGDTLTDLSSYVDASNTSYNGNAESGGTVTVTMSTGVPTTKDWKIILGPIKSSSINYWNNISLGNGKVKVELQGGNLVIYSKSSNNGGYQLSDSESFTFGIAMDCNALTPGGATSSGNGKLVEIIESYMTNDDDKKRIVDYHPYRYLVVLNNNDVSSVNRSVVADMVQYANTQRVGLAGGIVVDCMSVEQFANISVDLKETYDGICVENTANLLGVGKTKYDDEYPDDRKIATFSNASILSKFEADLGNRIGVRYITEPKEYVNPFMSTFKSENPTANGWDMYTTANEADLNSNTTYLNSTTKELNFKLDISGPVSSYDVYLYVDVDNNHIFNTYESVYESGSEWNIGSEVDHKLGTASKNTPFTRNVALTNILGEDFAGGFSWKLVVKGGSQSVSRVGFSAIKVTEQGQKEIRILQIYPTDYGSTYHQDGPDDSGYEADVHSNPLIVLPTKLEVSAANNAHKDSEGNPGKITDYIPTAGSGLTAVKKYFSGKLHINNRLSSDNKKLFWSDDTNKTAADLGDQYRDAILLNSSLLYYYFEKLNTYELDVTKYSVAQFNNKFDITGAVNPEIYYNESTNKFYKIEHGKEVDFDLVMLGFGTSMDYMAPDAVDKIELYLQNGGSAFVGSGTVTKTHNNNLGHRIYDEIGMTTSENPTNKSGYYTLEYSSADASTMMITNNTLFTHYPYTVNHYLKGGGEMMEAYKLNIDSSNLVCTYVKYNSDSSDDQYGMWGHVKQNYYLYKYKGVTYCAFGKTWNAEEIGQDNGVMTPAEAQIIVNALITAARNGSDSTSDDPYLNCDDPDRSVITLEEPDFLPDGTVDPSSTKIWKLRDSVYTDYDSFGMAQTAIGGTLSFEVTSPSGGIIVNTSTDATIRWIPYYYETTVDGGATLIFATDEAGTHPITQIGVKEGTVSSTGTFPMGSAGTYTIGVPLDKDTYGGANLGFELTSTKSNDQFKFYILLKRNKDNKIIETHEVVMVRRVLYPVN